MTEFVMYCVFAKPSVAAMKGNRGKLGAMAGHAFLHAYWNAERRFPSYHGGLGGDSIGDPERYKKSGMAKKVCLVVETVEELHALEAKYKPVCGVSLVTDAALTVFDAPTTVCLGIGPIGRPDVCPDLQALKVFI